MINNQNLAVLSEKVAYLEGAIKTAGVLPDVSASNNGSALQVVEGAWAIGDPIPGVVNALDSTSTTDALSAAQGKVLNEKVDGKVVLSIPANTYSKYSEALTAMQTEYNNLSLVEKRRTIIAIDNSLIASIFHSNGRYTYSTASSNANYIVTISLDTHTYYISTIGTNSTTFQDNSEAEQTLALQLIII